MKKLYTLLVFVFITMNTHGQINFEFAKKFTYSQDNNGEPHSITSDTFGNTYICGSFGGNVDFDPDPEQQHIVTSNTGSNIFLAKYDTNGNFLWVKTFLGMFSNLAVTVKTDTAGNCYFGAVFQDDVTYDYNGTQLTLDNQGQSDFLIAKIMPDGTYNWLKTFGSAGLDECGALNIGPDGEIVVIGNYNETTDFDPGEGTFNLTSQGDTDVFLLKLDNDGEFIWAKSFGGTDGDIGDAVNVATDGDIYMSGRFRGTAQFNSTANNQFTSNGATDVFVSKLNNSGEILWIKAFGGDYFEDSNTILTNADGSIYLSGTFGTTVAFSTNTPETTFTSFGSIDAFILKYGQDGNLNWVKQYGGASADRINSIIKKGTHIYGIANIYGTADYDPTEGEALFTPVGTGNTLLLDFNESGEFIWGGQIGNNMVEGRAITVDNNYNIYATGLFDGLNDFDPGANVFEMTTVPELYDFFLLKLSQPGIVSLPSFQTSSVKLYPNPNNGTFSIEFNKAFPITQATIYNIAGQQVASQTFINTPVLQMDTQLSPGVYMVKAGSENNFTQIFKIIVQ